MAKVKQGLWEVRGGKGDRHYLSCDGTYTGIGEGVMHPEQLAGLNGVGMYGHEHLQDLAIAILLFERKAGRGYQLLERFNSVVRGDNG